MAENLQVFIVVRRHALVVEAIIIRELPVDSEPPENAQQDIVIWIFVLQDQDFFISRYWGCYNHRPEI